MGSKHKDNSKTQIQATNVKMTYGCTATKSSRTENRPAPGTRYRGASTMLQLILGSNLYWGMIIKKGTKAPDFVLYSSEKKQVHLTGAMDKNVLLLFFPLAFTSTCTKELCMVRDDFGRYNDLQATVFAISVDSPQTLARYKEDQRLNFTLLSDFNKEVSRAYGALYEEFSLGMRGVSKRAAFVIDRNGIVQYAEVLENAGQLPNFDVINAMLTELK